MQCGREPGGENTEKGICPVALPNHLDRINHGTNGGRVCWAMDHNLCESRFHDSHIQRLENCFRCSFLNDVHDEESHNFILLPKS